MLGVDTYTCVRLASMAFRVLANRRPHSLLVQKLTNSISLSSWLPICLLRATYWFQACYNNWLHSQTELFISELLHLVLKPAVSVTAQKGLSEAPALTICVTQGLNTVCHTSPEELSHRGTHGCLCTCFQLTNLLITVMCFFLSWYNPKSKRSLDSEEKRSLFISSIQYFYISDYDIQCIP